MKAYSIECGGWRCDIPGHECVIGVVRCPDGDLDAFEAGAAQVRDWSGCESDVAVKPVEWGWFRMNPDPSREYPWLLAEATGPGRGNWRGARVLIVTPARAGTSEADR